MHARVSPWLRLEAALLALAMLMALAPLPAFAQEVSPAAAKKLGEARKLLVTDPEQALAVSQSVARGAASAPADLASARELAAEASLRLGQLDQAEQLLAAANKAAAQVKGPLGARGDMLLTQGGIEQARGRVAQALGSYQRAFGMFQTLGDTRSQAVSLSAIASLYREGRDFANAEKYFRQAADIYSGDPLFELAMRNNRGNVLRQMERFDDAILEYRQALKLADRIDSPLLRVRILANIARNQIEKGDIAAGDGTLAHALALSQSGEARGWRPQVLAIMAHAAYLRGDTALAGRLIDRAFAGVDPGDVPASLRDAHDIAYEIYARLGDTKRALAHLEAVRALNDESAKVATSTNAALMAARFDYQNQELRIARLRADELKNKVAFERSRAAFQRALFAAIAVAVAVVIALLSYFVVRLRRSRNIIRAANVELGETNRALEKALAAKTEFLATTSHEIRTPLNGILGMTQVMLADQRLDAGVRDRIGVVHGAGVTMKALVDDILDVAKMETGNLTVDAVPMDLIATLRDVTRMWEEQARGRGIGFALELDGAPQWIECDPSRLRQIIFNLLSNALKFTEAGGVSVRVATNGSGADARIAIAVQDSGIGIPAEKFDEVFESFKQVDAGTTRKFGGTGLGLAICRNLARALGGDIRLESVLGKGSVFTLDLPLVPAEAPEQAGAAKGAGAGGMIVLDRNPIARSMLKTLFEPLVDSLRFAGSADEAAAMLGDGGCAVLLIDAATLAAAGDAIAEIARLGDAAHGAGARAAVLWVRPTPEDIVAVSAAGADLCIAKPIGGPALVKAIFGDACATNDARPLVSHAA